jgi:hypothetical protein
MTELRRIVSSVSSGDAAAVGNAVANADAAAALATTEANRAETEADRAESGADNAEASVILASDAADRAEAAALTGGYYPTIAAGDAATSAPNTFISDENGPLSVYDADGNFLALVAEYAKKTPYDYGATGGYSTLAAAQAGDDDTVPIRALLAAWTADPSIVPDFSGRYWKISQPIVFEQNELHRAAYAIGGSFVAAAGSSGDNLITLDIRYGAVEGEFGAYGTGGVSYATRTWTNGIFMRDSTRCRVPSWTAENFKRDGLSIYQPTDVENNIALVVGAGRAVNCGSTLRQGTAELSDTYTVSSRTGSSGSTAQRTIVNMANPIPTEVAIDDIVYIAEPVETINFTGDGTTDKFQLSTEKYWRTQEMTVTVGGVAITPETGYTLIEKNVIDFAVIPSAAAAIVVSIERWTPYVIQAIGASQLTLAYWTHSTATTGRLVYGHGAGLRLDGSNTASGSFGMVEGFRCGSIGLISGLYAGKFDGFQGQAAGCNVTIGNPPTSASWGIDISFRHAESTAFDLIALSTSPYRGSLGTASAQGVQTSSGAGDTYGQIAQVGPRLTNDSPATGFSTLKGVDFYGDLGLVEHRAGVTRGLSVSTMNLSNQPQECFATQKRNSATYRLKFYPQLDSIMTGYNTIDFTVFGTNAGGGPTGAQTVNCVDVDEAAGYTVNGGESVTIPASNYPIHVRCMMDNAAPLKNWLVRWTALRPQITASATFNPPSVAAAGTTTTTVTATGAALGDHVEASFSLSLQGMVLSAFVSAADTVTVVFFNPTAAAIDLANGTLRVLVNKA